MTGKTQPRCLANTISDFQCCVQWWELFEVDITDIQDIAAHIKCLYHLKYDRRILPLTVSELAKQL
jgi:hypothetical protein